MPFKDIDKNQLHGKKTSHSVLMTRPRTAVLMANKQAGSLLMASRNKMITPLFLPLLREGVGWGARLLPTTSEIGKPIKLVPCLRQPKTAVQ